MVRLDHRAKGGLVAHARLVEGDGDLGEVVDPEGRGEVARVRDDDGEGGPGRQSGHLHAQVGAVPVRVADGQVEAGDALDAEPARPLAVGDVQEADAEKLDEMERKKICTHVQYTIPVHTTCRVYPTRLGTFDIFQA